MLLEFGTLPDRVSAGTPAETTVSITDDDEPGLTVSRQTLNVVQGRSASYTLALDTRPADNATVTPVSDNPDVTFSPSEVIFTPTDWEMRKQVTVSAPAGSAGQSATITHTVSGYPGVTTVPGVDVTVTAPPPPPIQPATPTTPPASTGGGGGGGSGGRVVITPPPATTGGGGAPLNRVPVFTEGSATDRSIAENTPAGASFGEPVAARDREDDTLAYALGGPDAGSFGIDAGTGQIRVGAGTALDYEAGKNVYRVTVTARDSSGARATIAVTITVTGADLGPYDVNKNEAIDSDEALAAVVDYFAGRITRAEVVGVVRLYFAG